MEIQIPQTLQQAVLYFADPNNCLEFIKMLRWPNGVACQKCGCQRRTYIKSRQLFICRQCKEDLQLQGWYDLREKQNSFGQMAADHVACLQLQERYQFLGGCP